MIRNNKSYVTYTINRVTSTFLLALIFLQSSQCSAENVLQTQTAQPSQNVTLFFNITLNGYISLQNILPSSPESPENGYDEEEADFIPQDSSLSQDIAFIENAAGLKNVSCSSTLANGFTYVDNHEFDKEIVSSLIYESGKNSLDFIISSSMDNAASILKDDFQQISESESIPRVINMCLYYVKFQKSAVNNSNILFNDQSNVFVVVLEPKEALTNENILLAKKLDRNCLMGDRDNASNVAGYKILETPDIKMIILFFPQVKEQEDLQAINDLIDFQNKVIKLENEDTLVNLEESSKNGEDMVVLSFPEVSAQRERIDAHLEQIVFHLKELLKGLEQPLDAEGEETSSSNKVTIENLTSDELLASDEITSPLSNEQVFISDDASLDKSKKMFPTLLKQYTSKASECDNPKNVGKMEEGDSANTSPEDAEDYQVINATTVLKAVDENISRHEKDCRYSYCEETRIKYRIPLSNKMLDTKYFDDESEKSKDESKSKIDDEIIGIIGSRLKENQMKRAKGKRKLSEKMLQKYMKEVELLSQLRDNVFTRT